MRKMFTLFAALTLAAAMYATEGTLPGVFTINKKGDRVLFAKGNLQYVGTWQFAGNQWDIFGDAQSDNHRDLFGWGTGDAPNKVSMDYNDYATFTDWGVNAISNGGNEANAWRTLTKDEWVYLFYGRTNAATLFALGSVSGVNGTILLPDNWTLPAGASFTASTTQGLAYQGDYYSNESRNNFSHNTYTAAQWKVMEQAGAVFLPATGLRLGTDVLYVGSFGNYWSATPHDTNIAFYLGFDPFSLSPRFGAYRLDGLAVRLVTTLSIYTVTFNDWDGTVLKTEEVERGESVTAPADPTREGCTFVGWDTDLTNITSDLTITAVYSKPLTGRFSVAEDKQIVFAQGNLQYKASDGKWKLADNQYDFIGENNAKSSPTYNGWIDLFGFASSGKYIAPWEKSTESAPYATGTLAGTIARTDYDWLTYNAEKIVNADGKTWQLMPAAEWEYLLNTRPEAVSKQGQAVVNDVKGYILLPDVWTQPAGLSFTPLPNNYTTNIFTADQWAQMEAAGAVFLPAAGQRYGTDVNGLTAGNGYYWTGELAEYNDMATCISITAYQSTRKTISMRCNGSSIRPVREVGEHEGIDEVPSDQVQSTKVIENGVLYLMYKGTKYNVQGAEVR